MILPADTIKLENIRQEYNFYTSQVYEETRRHQFNDYIHLKKVMGSYGKKWAEIINALNVTYCMMHSNVLTSDLPPAVDTYEEDVKKKMSA